MKRWFLIAGWLACAAPAANAQIYMSWTDCLADGGAQSRTSACASEIGTNRLVVAYTMPQDLTNFVAMDAQIDLMADYSPLPPWWDLKNAGACRETAATISIDGTILPSYTGACADTWGFGASATGLFTGYALGYGGDPTRARAVFAIARAASDPIDLTNGQNYLGFIWSISNAGTATCTGCTDPIVLACTQIVLSSLNPVNLQEVNESVVLVAMNNFDPCASWNGGNCGIVPTRPKTWGTVKALYR